MAKVIGDVTGPAGERRVLLPEALQHALENAPGPGPGTDVQTFRLLAVEIEHGGITGATRTRVTLDVEDGPLP